MAAEGAILNEMLDIVAKRAALRSNDPQYGMNSIESDVSLDLHYIAHAIFHDKFICKWLITIVLIVLCMYFVYSARI